MDINTKKSLIKFTSTVSKENSPRLFLPFILIAVPCIIFDILTFGLGLIFTSFIWLMLDIEIFRFLRTGETRFNCYYHNGISFKTIFVVAMLRRLIILIGYVCFIIPGFYLSIRLSGLANTIITNPTQNNPIKLLQQTYQDSKPEQLDLIALRLNTFYIIVLTIVSFGIIAPWSVPYFKSLRIAYYMTSKNLEFAPKLIEQGYEELSPPEYIQQETTQQ